MISKFWNKVNSCDHKNLYKDYCVFIHCSTPGCRGHEYHCKNCKVFILDCLCHDNGYGVSGWSDKRYKNFIRKKIEKSKRGQSPIDKDLYSL